MNRKQAAFRISIELCRKVRPELYLRHVDFPTYDLPTQSDEIMAGYFLIFLIVALCVVPDLWSTNSLRASKRSKRERWIRAALPHRFVSRLRAISLALRRTVRD
jgi:hypothetical protein